MTVNEVRCYAGLVFFNTFCCLRRAINLTGLVGSKRKRDRLEIYLLVIIYQGGEFLLHIEHILADPQYRAHLEKNQLWEEDRPFCRHDFEHMLAVARIAYLLVLERNAGISREIAYAAGLLHDIGRWEQYQRGVPHADASAEAAEGILTRAGFDGGERALICRAIREHNAKDGVKEEGKISILGMALQEADKYARLCWCCSARGNCYKLTEMPHKETLRY